MEPAKSFAIQTVCVLVMSGVIACGGSEVAPTDAGLTDSTSRDSGNGSTSDARVEASIPFDTREQPDVRPDTPTVASDSSVTCGAQCVMSDGTAAGTQRAIDAASDGWTVQLPAGSFTWTRGVEIRNKGIHIRGAGAGGILGYSNSTAAIGNGARTFETQAGLSIAPGEMLRVLYTARGDNYVEGTVTSYTGTTLVLAVSSNGGSGTHTFWTFTRPAITTITNNAVNDWGEAMFDIDTDASASVELSGIHLVAGTAERGSHVDFGAVATDRPVKIHDMWFSMGTGMRSIWAHANIGLIYGCSFDSGFSSVFPSDAANDQAIGITALGVTTSWSTESTMGTADTTGLSNLYVEDNQFVGINLQTLDPDSNSRVVIRHNVFNNSGLASHGRDTSESSLRHFELYDNVFVFNDVNMETYALSNGWMYLRGGTGVIADNVVPDIRSSWWGNASEWKFTVQAIRRNVGCFTTYPAPQQIGQGFVGGMLAREPLYIWGNTGFRGSNTPSLADYDPDECGNDERVEEYVQAGRDYIVGTPKPGYVKYPYPHPLR